MGKIFLPGVQVIELNAHRDERGNFIEMFSVLNNPFTSDFNLKQVNYVFSKNIYTLRGLHYQKKPMEQGKIVSCIKGSILDVIVDINPKSNNYKKYFSTILSSISNDQIFVPRGFAHGYLTLTDDVEVIYFVDNYYDPSQEVTIKFDDPSLKIDWGVELDKIIVSDKDSKGICFSDLERK